MLTAQETKPKADRGRIKTLMAESPLLFGRVILGERKMSVASPDFHHEIIETLRDDTSPRKVIIAPRGHAKSTVACVIYPIWLIAHRRLERDGEFYILIISEAQEQAMNFLDTIANIIEENPRFHSYFPHVRPGDKWTNKEIKTSNGVRIKALGTGQKVRGQNYRLQRPNLIIMDDFESEKNSLTPEARDRNIRWGSGAVSKSLAPDGQLVLIGTIVHEDTFLTRSAKNPAYRTRSYQARYDPYEDWNTSGEPKMLWPDWYSLERWEAERASAEFEGTLSTFYMEMQNVPIPPGDRTFNEADFRYWDGRFFVLDSKQYIEITWLDGEYLDPPRVRPINPFVSVDLAARRHAGADFNVILPGGADSDGDIFVEDYERFRGQPDRVIDAIFQAWWRYRPTLIIIEEVGYQSVLESFLQLKMEETNTFMPIEPIRWRETRTEFRCRQLQPYFKRRKIFIKRTHETMKMELLAFPKGTHDDLVSTLNDIITYVAPAIGKRLEVFDRYEPEFPEEVDAMLL